MPQFAQKTHPAREHMLAFGRRWPAIWSELDELRRANAHPPHVYITDEEAGQALAKAMFTAGAGEGLKRTLADGGLSALSVAMHASNAATLGAWRMTQGIYRIDPALYADLISTTLIGDIPADVLLRLPEWCVYVETPGLRGTGRSGDGFDVRGAWARVDEHNDRELLVIAVDIAGEADPQPHTLNLRGTIEGSLTAIAQEYAASGLLPGESAGWLETTGVVADYIAPVINVLLYLCSTGDIAGKQGAPGNPVPVRTRRDGWKLFAAQGPRMWDVGVRMGAALRRAYQAEQTGAGGERQGPRPHVRRAHWHTFVSGARKRPDGTEIPAADRRRDLRWLPPIPVNLDDIDALPAVIRRV